MFEIMINNQTFESESYVDFCKDIELWHEIEKVSNFQGTAGDWRYIALCLHSAITEAIDTGQYDKWLGIYKPYSIPAIGFKITKGESL